jgi:hypothetical protein
VVAHLPLDPRFMGSSPAEGDGFFKATKNPQQDFLQRGSNIIVPML